MFFSWFRENKQFKKRSDLSGQITPFLLVVLVILLIAAIATINIGRVSLDKTCSANAADAGVLAAASVYATAFNNLAQMNANMEDRFDYAYLSEYQPTYELSREYLNETIIYALTASALAAAAYADSMTPLLCYVVWVIGLEIAAQDIAAAAALEQAYLALSSFYLTVQYLESITQSFHEAQWEAFCNSVVSMDNAYESAYNAGFTYAFSNSCISSKLSDTQNDEFSLWMSSFTTKSGDIDEWMLAKPAKDGVYRWMDKVVDEVSNPKPSQEHIVNAALDLPKITSYEVQHTIGRYSEIIDLLDYIIAQAPIIASAFNSAAEILATTAAGFIAVVAFSTITVIKWKCCWAGGKAAIVCCPAYALWCGKTLALKNTLKIDQSWVVALLSSFVAAAGSLSLYLLQASNDKAYKYWYPDGVQSIKNCQDCQPCRNDEDDDLKYCKPCQAVSDLMIVRIFEVILPYWYTICTNTQTHPGTSTGIMATKYPTLTSTSKATFDGGDVGNFEYTYDAKIVETK